VLQEGIHRGDAFKLLKKVPSNSISLIVTDPPFNTSRENNLETMGRRGIDFPWDGGFDQVGWLKDAVRVLRKGGTFVEFNDWKNLGDIAKALKLLGMDPKRPLQWYKCLSGSTKVYVKHGTKQGPMTIKDLARCKVGKVWTGENWSKVLAVDINKSPDSPLEIELRSGEVLKCTSNHVWPTSRGNIMASSLSVGDVIDYCAIPATNTCTASWLHSVEIGWFVGLYIAEGSRSSGKKNPSIDFSGHIKEAERFLRLRKIAEAFHGTAALHPAAKGQGAVVSVYSKILDAILRMYVAGKLSYGKHLSKKSWTRDNDFLRGVLQGYLDGDGSYDEDNDRWRLRFTGKNRALAEDLRTLCARLDLPIRLKLGVVKGFGEEYAAYKGTIRLSRVDHPRTRVDTQIVEIRPCRWATTFWDICIEDEPHTFALASGVMTHNSNPMPRNKGRAIVQRMEYAVYAVKPGKWTFNLGAAPIRNRKCCKTDIGEGNKYCRECGLRAAKKGYEDGVFYFPVQRDIVHPTKKPDELWEDIIKLFTNDGDWVLDPFAGAGTLAVAATNTNRKHISFELDDFYYYYGKSRWRKAQNERG